MSEAMFQYSGSGVQTTTELPDRKYFKIGEAANLLGVKPHVLRYWETEFPQIRPYKSRTGQRLYRRRDVEALQHIQKLLYKERYTIAGARQALRAMYENEMPPNDEMALVDDPVESSSLLPVELAAPSLTSETLAPQQDVLEVVEQKMLKEAQNALGIQMTNRLENAKRRLVEMLELLKA